MSDAIDANDIAAKVVVQLTQNAAAQFTHAVAEKVRSVKVSLHVGFRRYIEGMVAVYGNVKTLFNPDKAIPVEQFYVSVRLQGEKRVLSDNNLLDDLTSIKKLIVTGNAGTGKSMFLRHAFMHVLKNYTYTLPIYLELRYLSDGVSILDAANESVRQYVPDITKEIFEEGLKISRFAIFLDGFDELSVQSRSAALTEIRTMCRNMPGLVLVITTRPTDAILTLPNFTNFRVQPFTTLQISDLLSKLRVDHEKYTDFIRRLKAGLYEEHKDFLSNPLLATMMFMTFCRVSDISSRMHVFYNDAFHVLAQWHDRSKGAYTREFKSGMDITAFKDVFSVFCAYSYFDNNYTFTELELRDYIKSALRYWSSMIKVDDVIIDFCESTSLIQRDGTRYTFVHRSFQEYFTAVFLKELDDNEFCRGIENLVDRGDTDNVLLMLRDLQRNRFDTIWLIPYVKDVLRSIGNEDWSAEEHIRKYPRSIVFEGTSIRFTVEWESIDSAKLFAVRRLFGYDRRVEKLSEIERTVWPKFRALLEVQHSQAWINQLRAAFGVEWVFKVSTNEQLRFPRRQALDLEGLPAEFVELLGVSKLLREEVTFLEGLVKSLERVESRKQAGLRQMFRPRTEGAGN